MALLSVNLQRVLVLLHLLQVVFVVLLLPLEVAIPHLGQRIDIDALLVRHHGHQVVTLAVLVHNYVFMPICEGFILAHLWQLQEAHRLALKCFLAIDKELFDAELSLNTSCRLHCHLFGFYRLQTL